MGVRNYFLNKILLQLHERKRFTSTAEFVVTLGHKPQQQLHMPEAEHRNVSDHS